MCLYYYMDTYGHQSISNGLVIGFDILSFCQNLSIMLSNGLTFRLAKFVNLVNSRPKRTYLCALRLRASYERSTET